MLSHMFHFLAVLIMKFVLFTAALLSDRMWRQCGVVKPITTAISSILVELHLSVGPLFHMQMPPSSTLTVAMSSSIPVLMFLATACGIHMPQPT